MEWKYWKVVVHYGHVGRKNEVSVARYLVMPADSCLNDVLTTVWHMPGTKSHAVHSAKMISFEEFLEGQRKEKEDFFLQCLFNQNVAN